MEITLNTAYSFKQTGKRPNQEDARYPDVDVADATCFVVCDGVGGNEAGEVASNTVCQSLGKSVGKLPAHQAFGHETLAHVLSQAYRDLRAARRADTHNMATTMTMAVFHPAGVSLSHIGDSRIYQFRKGEGIHYRSTDHSLVQELVAIGKLTDDEARNHPHSNIITRSMSANDKDGCPATTLTTADIAVGDIFLLCTDGVVSEITDTELTDLLLCEASDEDKIRRLAATCRNSSDNNTAFMVSVAGVVQDGTDADMPAPTIPTDVAPAHDAGWLDKVRDCLNRFRK